MSAFTTEVVICTYNGQRHIVEQLKSIEQQTRPVDRVSIFDDGSFDQTVALIRDFIETLPTLRRCAFHLVIRESNLGYAQNFADAIGRATQDIVFLCDQDDVWEAGKVQCVLDAFAHSSADMVCSDGSLIDASGNPLGQRSVLASYGLAEPHIGRFGAAAFARLLRRNYVNGAASAVRRVTAQRALPLPTDMPHDYWLALWCALHGGVSLLASRLYRYRQHEANAIGMGSDRLLYRWLGIWRSPRKPRERELRIWSAVMTRIGGCGRDADIRLARQKVAWLSALLDRDRPALSRLWLMLHSLVDGRYRRYSPADAPLRDFVALLKG